MNHIAQLSKTAFIVAAAAALAACSSAPRKPDYQCAIEDVEAAKCASVQEAFAASNSMQPKGQSRVQSVFDSRVQGSAPVAQPSTAQPVFQGQLSNHPAPSTNGDPVFKQPEVKRVWVRPYVDGDGNLRSGEYVYFSTPGKWSHGGLNKPGAAAKATGMFGPARTDNLGFNPVMEQPKSAPKPPAPGAAADGTGAKPAPATNASGITQPFQRLTPSK